MPEEQLPEIVFEISMPFSRVTALISDATKNTPFLHITRDESGNSWHIQGRDDSGSCEIECELFVASRDQTCDLHFAAKSEKGSDNLCLAVGICLSVLFPGCQVMTPTMKRLEELPGLSDACSKRIASLLQSHEPMTITEISKSLAIIEYTAAVNLQDLLKKGIIGCTPSQVVPRKYFYK